MVESQKDPKLASLEERLKAARKQVEPDPEPSDRETSMGRAFQMGIEMVAGVGVGVLIGLTLDNWLATPPLFLFVFLILGFAAGMRSVFRQARKMQAENDEDGASGA